MTPWVSFDGKNCGGCNHLNERGYCEFTACIIPCSVSATIPAVKPQTNGDRIRRMTDEELAEFIEKMEVQGYDLDGTFGKQYWLEWLKQEAD